MADSTLAALTAATASTGGLFYGTQSGADRKFTLTAAGAALAEAADASAQRTALGLGTIATADIASQAEAEAGSSNTKAMTPLRTAQAIAALGGGAALLPHHYFVDPMNGDDGTGTVGDVSLPYETAQAAFDDGVAGGVDFTLVLERGTCTGITVGADMAVTCRLIGRGYKVSKLGGISSLGAAGAAAPDPDSPGGAGTASHEMRFDSDGSVDVGPVISTGGAGATGGSNDQAGGRGGDRGNVRLRGIFSSGYAELKSGNGGDIGGSIATGGASGDCGTVTLFGCNFASQSNGSPIEQGTGGAGTPQGSTGSPGVVKVSNCTFNLGLMLTGDTGSYVLMSSAETLTLSGVTNVGSVERGSGTPNPFE